MLRRGQRAGRTATETSQPPRRRPLTAAGLDIASVLKRSKSLRLCAALLVACLPLCRRLGECQRNPPYPSFGLCQCVLLEVAPKPPHAWSMAIAQVRCARGSVDHESKSDIHPVIQVHSSLAQESASLSQRPITDCSFALRGGSHAIGAVATHCSSLSLASGSIDSAVCAAGARVRPGCPVPYVQACLLAVLADIAGAMHAMKQAALFGSDWSSPQWQEHHNLFQRPACATYIACELQSTARRTQCY